jgi:hypothetical protein
MSDSWGDDAYYGGVWLLNNEWYTWDYTEFQWLKVTRVLDYLGRILN